MEQANVVQASNSQVLWHERLGHLNHHSMNLLKNKLATAMTYEDPETPVLCVSCIKGKQARKPFPYNKIKGVVKNKLDLIHSDLVGPMEVESWGGARFMLTFIDDHSRKIFCYFLKSKDEVPDIFEEFCALVENETERKIKVLRTDNGGEYCNQRLKTFLRYHGIKHELTVPYCPQQNGVAERYNRSIMEKVRAMMTDAKCQKRMWAEAANTAVYLLNRSPTKKIRGATPEERWTGKKVNLSHLKVFGCRAYAHVPDAKRQKLDEKSKEYIFVGYSETVAGYRLMDPNSHRLKIVRDVIFLEDNFDECSEKIEDPVKLNLSFPLEEGDKDEGETSIESFADSYEEDVQQKETEGNEEGNEGTSLTDPKICNEVIVRSNENTSDMSRYPKRSVRKPKIYEDYVMSNVDFAMLVESVDLEHLNILEALPSVKKKIKHKDKR